MDLNPNWPPPRATHNPTVEGSSPSGPIFYGFPESAMSLFMTISASAASISDCRSIPSDAICACTLPVLRPNATAHRAASSASDTDAGRRPLPLDIARLPARSRLESTQPLHRAYDRGLADFPRGHSAQEQFDYVRLFGVRLYFLSRHFAISKVTFSSIAISASARSCRASTFAFAYTRLNIVSSACPN